MIYQFPQRGTVSQCPVAQKVPVAGLQRLQASSSWQDLPESTRLGIESALRTSVGEVAIISFEEFLSAASVGYELEALS